jgi:hypothetical protein
VANTTTTRLAAVLTIAVLATSASALAGAFGVSRERTGVEQPD